ncbi:hypothetical protein D3C81_2321540 [compost metagenome]
MVEFFCGDVAGGEVADDQALGEDVIQITVAGMLKSLQRTVDFDVRAHQSTSSRACSTA